MNLNISIHSFEELDIHNLYEMLRLRASVFILEQDCVYQDLDNKDHKAIHLLGTIDNEIVAYTRIFDAGDYFENAAIGRVVVATTHRNLQLGHAIVEAAITQVSKIFKRDLITISAQLYLQRFYESHGFVQTSTQYLEDGIPHIEMKRGL